MARVYYGSTVRRIMGKIGNQIYSARGPYEYIKSYNHKPYDPNTPRQQEVRNTFDELTDDWVAMPEENKKLWSKFALLKHQYVDGISSYLQHNLRLLLSKNESLTKIDKPPLNPAGIRGIPGFSITPVVSKNIINWEYPYPGGSLFCQIFFRHHDPNLLDIKVYWALIITVPVSDLTYDHEHEFPAGTVLHYHLRLIDTFGRITPYTFMIKVTCQ